MAASACSQGEQPGEEPIQGLKSGLWRNDCPDESMPFEGEGPRYAELSDTGLYCDIEHGWFHPDVRFYRPGSELWADGAEKRRFLSLPPGTQIDTVDMDGWVFPVGTRVWKEFRKGHRKLETRLLEKLEDGTWYSMAFVWNAEGSEAYPAPDGEMDVVGTQHDVPSVANCGFCHRNASDTLIGVSALLLADGSHPFGVTLRKLARAGRLTDPPAERVRFPGSRLDRRALGYLQANCAGCHGGGRPFAGLDLSTSVHDAQVSDTMAYQTSVGQPLSRWTDYGFDTRIVAGVPEESGVLARMDSREDGVSMPPLGSEKVDKRAVRTMTRWIESLE